MRLLGVKVGPKPTGMGLGPATHNFRGFGFGVWGFRAWGFRGLGFGGLGV